MTDVLDDGAEREGAFRFLESDDVSTEEVAAAAHRACVDRCFGHRFVFVPVDGSSLSVTDRIGDRGLGLVGARSKKSPGLNVMSAIGVAPDGTPLGILAQSYWARTKRSTGTKKDRRPVADKETQVWLDVVRSVRTTMDMSGAATIPWFQLDRGGDAWPVLLEAVGAVALFTVRASYSRRLETAGDGKQEYLWPRLARSEPLGSYALDVPGGPRRQARQAVMQVQSCPVTLDLQDNRTQRHMSASLWAVRAVEVGTTPPGEDRLEWLLLTTFEVTGLEAAHLVLDGYTTRWRIEEFHKTWKTGACNVEDTQLRTADRIERWATILASVAMRLLRLTYLSRHCADEPASVELSRPEVEAIILAKKPRGVRRSAKPTIGQAVRWLAELGGYTGKSSGGPPGAIVIRRGLERIETLARVLSDRGKL